MKKIIFAIILSSCLNGVSQDIVKLKDIKPKEEYDNILVQSYFSDENQSAFIIWVKSEVPLHKHQKHTENIYIIEGKGEMTIGNETFIVKKGDYFTIPMNTPHALKVNSSRPMKALSIQSPKFIGIDRIFINQD